MTSFPNRAIRLRPIGLFPLTGTAGPRGDASMRQIRLGKAGRCGEIPAHTIFLFDDSGSVTGGNDSIGRRYEEAAEAVHRVGAACRCRNCRVSVVHFDPRPDDCVIAEPVSDRAAISRVYESFRASAGTGSSNLGPALAMVPSLVAKTRGFDHTLVVMSDFELFDADVPEVVSRFADFAGNRLAVVLRSAGGHALMTDDGAPWSGEITAHLVADGTPIGAIARAVFGALCAHRSGADPLPIEP